MGKDGYQYKGIQAQIITDRKLWNDFVAKSLHCNITQTYEWGELMQERHAETLYIGVFDEEGQLCAAMLLLISKLSLLHTPYFYAPRGPIIDDPASPAMTVLLNFVKAEAHKRGVCMLKIEPDAHDGDTQWLTALQARGFRPNPHANHLRHEWVLDIRPDEEQILANMKKTWRYGVRLASRKEVQVREGQGSADIDIFYHLLHTTSDRHDFFIFERDFYHRFMQLYGERAKLFIAEYQGQPLGATILVVHGRWCWYMYAASDNEHRDRMPNHLLQWTAFRWAKAQGCWYYNFRGIPDILEEGQPMWGLYTFKSGFGGHAMRSLQTHDLVYRPMSYAIYRVLLDAKHWYDEKQANKNKKSVTKDSTQNRDAQNTPAREDG
jgi:lipid II:glycine glycyltransferase (peptidoglycan interpeptide bridge formation enzyme)